MKAPRWKALTNNQKPQNPSKNLTKKIIKQQTTNPQLTGEVDAKNHLDQAPQSIVP